jgi:co-chaperonin GroES (HSP10)
VVEKKTAGGIIKPDALVDQEQGGAIEATVIAMSPLAFTYEDGAKDMAPSIGDRVIIARYKGARVDGLDGVEYHLINDKDILARKG